MAVQPIPKGYHVITPILIVDDADALLEFLKGAFGAREHRITRRRDGRILHADVTIDGDHVMISEGRSENTSAAVNLYVPDTDAAYRRAVSAGATSIAAPTDRFYGDRNAVVKDPSGIMWSIATHLEDVPEEELARREAEALNHMEGDTH